MVIILPPLVKNGCGHGGSSRFKVQSSRFKVRSLGLCKGPPFCHAEGAKLPKNFIDEKVWFSQRSQVQGKPRTTFAFNLEL
jgi:hypothetical protein